MTTQISPVVMKWLIPATLATGISVVVAVSRIPAEHEFLVYSAEELASVENIHDYKGKPVCQACHRGNSIWLKDDPVVVCTEGCHSFEHGNHPVSVVQREPADTGLPMGAGNLVVCHSCHDPHDMTKFKHGLRMEFSALCLRCHSSH